MFVSKNRSVKDATLEEASLSLSNLEPEDVSALNEEIEGLNKAKMDEHMGLKAKTLLPVLKKLVAEADHRRLEEWGRKSKVAGPKDVRSETHGHKSEVKYDSSDPEFVTFLTRFEDYIGNVQQLAANKHLDAAEQQRLLRILAAMQGPISQALTKKNWIFVPTQQVREFLGVFFGLLSQIRELLSQIVKVKMGFCCNSAADDLKKQLKLRIPDLESKIWAFPILFGLEGRHVTIINHPEPERSGKDLPPLMLDDKVVLAAVTGHLTADCPDLQPMLRMKVKKEVEYVNVPVEKIVHREAPVREPLGVSTAVPQDTDKLVAANEHMFGFGRKKDVAAAFRLYQAADNEGCLVASTCLGKMYLEGNGVTRSLEKARYHFQKAAEKGEPEAAYQLGKMYEKGLVGGVDKTQGLAKAAELYEEAGRNGHSEALTDLGYIFEKGLGVEASEVQAVECYKQAVALNNPRAMSNLGVYYLNKGPSDHTHQTRALELFKQGASLGSPLAQTNLGILYMKGLGVKQDYLAAQSLFEEAALKNDADALFYTTYFRIKDMQVHSSEDGYHEAAENLRRVLLMNPAHHDALYYLGYLYENGFGVQQDPKTALHFYTRAIDASEGKDGKSVYKTATLLFSGAVPGFQNKPKAIALYHKAADLGDCDAAFVLGVLYEEGKEVEYNRTVAQKYYNVAAKQGNTDAQFNLAMMQMAKLGETRPYLYQTVRDTHKGRTMDQKSMASEDTGLDDLTPEQLIVDAANKGNKRAVNFLQGRHMHPEIIPARNNFMADQLRDTFGSGSSEAVRRYAAEDSRTTARAQTNYSHYEGLLKDFMLK